jgi:hypothetical protein
MKKTFFFFAMLASIIANAQATRVEPIDVNYATKTVSFRLWWDNGSRDATHLSKVWVWVNYITVNSDNTTSGNSWTRALIPGAPAANVGTPSQEPGNDKGFWLQGNSGSYSATVTVELNITATKFNWCAYASDFPPNAIENTGTYTLKGSPPFIITTSTGTLQEDSETFTGGTITAFTDATGCPGVLCGKNGEAAGVLNCCVTGTTNCSGACTTTGTYTTYDGACTGACKTAYIQIKNQCGTVVTTNAGTYTNPSCGGCTPNPTYNPMCKSNPLGLGTVYEGDCEARCPAYAVGYTSYGFETAYETENTEWCTCYRCN